MHINKIQCSAWWRLDWSWAKKHFKKKGLKNNLGYVGQLYIIMSTKTLWWTASSSLSEGGVLQPNVLHNV